MSQAFGLFLKRVGSFFKRYSESLEVYKHRQKTLAVELPDRSYLSEDGRPYLTKRASEL